jgi:hypothetical protein
MPWRVTEISHLQLSSAQFFPLIWLLVLRGLWADTGRRELAVLGIAVALQLLSSFYLAYFLSFSTAVLVAVGAALRLPKLSDVARMAAAVAPGYALVGLSGLPYLQRQAGSDLAPEFGADISIGFGLSWEVFAARLQDAATQLNASANYHMPWGVALLAVFALGILIPRSRGGRANGEGSAASADRGSEQRLRIAVAGLVAICVFAFSMMLGGSVELGGFTLYLPSYFFSQVLPGFSMIRGPMRWGIVIAVAAPLLAGLGAAVVDRLLTSGRARVSARIVVAACVVLSLNFYTIPTRPAWTHPERIAKRYAALAALGEGPLLEIPWSAGPGNTPLASKNLLASTLHWRPIVNGYTGYLPATYRLIQRVGSALPARQSIERIRDLTGVRWILVDKTELPSAALESWERAAGRGWLSLGYSDESTLIFEIPNWEEGGRWIEALVGKEPRARTLTDLPRSPLQAEEGSGALLLKIPAEHDSSLRVEVIAVVQNASAVAWPGFDVQREGLVSLRYTYWPADSARGPSTDLAALDRDFPAASRTALSTFIRAPKQAGEYRLCVDLVQEIGDGLAPLPIQPVWRAVRVRGAMDLNAAATLFTTLYPEAAARPPCGSDPGEGTPRPEDRSAGASLHQRGSVGEARKFEAPQ